MSELSTEPDAGRRTPIPEVSLPVPSGSILAGKYRVDALLASGGMGIVAAGEHVALGQRVAIKFLRGTATPEAVARFMREAKACGRIQSDHIARVFDVDTIADGMPFMVMEHLSGTDLSVLLKERGRLPAAVAVDYVLQACEALAEAHREGIVHRDLKPANLFLTQRADGSPLVKVLDFGISKFRSRSEAPGTSDDLTTTNSMMGSPSYMSPEQLRSARDVDARADVWALGAVLYKLVAGRNPFSAPTTPDLCIQILTEPVPPIDDVDLPEGFRAVVAWCLEKDVARRCPNVAELAVALRPYAEPSSLASIERVVRTLDLPVAPVVRPPPRSAPADVPTAAPSVRDASGAGERRARPRVVVVASALLAGAAGLVLLASGGPRAAPSPAAAPLPLAASPVAAPSSPVSPPPSSVTIPDAPPAAALVSSSRSATPGVVRVPAKRPAAGRARPDVAPPPVAATALPAPSPPADEFGSFGARK
jgi:eukaryotic-like serine/threonine-protein kinase